MCLDCGCGKPNERHGDDRHITMDDIKAAANTSEMSVEEVSDNIRKGLDSSSSTSDS